MPAPNRVLGDDRYAVGAMSTRKLIFLSLLCGIAILAAFVAQLLIARP